MAETTQENSLAPIDQLLGYLGQQITTQQPAEADLYAAAKARYEPYYNEESALLKEYYDMQRNQAQRSYSANMSAIGAQRSQLQSELKLYMQQIETGRLRVGEDKERILARTLQDKKNALDQLAFQEQQKLGAINKGYISKEGLYSGSRQGALNTENQAYGYQTAGVEQQAGRTMDDAQTQYTRAMQDYAMEEKQKKTAANAGSGAGAGASASYQNQVEEANYAQKIKERSLGFEKENALMNYVYGDNAYSYLGL